MHEDHSFGVIPVRLEPDGRRYLIVQHHAGHWGFPKGHAEGDESPADAARRELAEETGIDQPELWADAPLTEQYVFTKRRSGRRVRKTVTYFIGLVRDPSVRAQPEEIHDLAWGTPAETRQRLTFPEARRLLDLAEARLDEQLGTATE